MKNILTESYRFPESGYDDKGEYIDEDELYRGYERDAESDEDKLSDLYGTDMHIQERDDVPEKTNIQGATESDMEKALTQVAEKLFGSDSDKESIQHLENKIWDVFDITSFGDREYLSGFIFGGVRTYLVPDQEYIRLKKFSMRLESKRDDVDNLLDYPEMHATKDGIMTLFKGTGVKSEFYQLITPRMFLALIPKRAPKQYEEIKEDVQSYTKTRYDGSDDLLEPDTEVDPYVYGGNGEKYTHNADELYNDFADEEELRKVAAESIMDQKMAEYFHALGERTGSQVVCEAALNIYREITKAYRK